MCYLIDLFGVYPIREDKPIWMLWYPKFPHQLLDLRGRALVRTMKNIVSPQRVHGDETFANEIGKELTVHDDPPLIHLSQSKDILPRHFIVSTPPTEEVDEEDEEAAAEAETERAAEAAGLLMSSFVLFYLFGGGSDSNDRSLLRV